MGHRIVLGESLFGFDDEHYVTREDGKEVLEAVGWESISIKPVEQVPAEIGVSSLRKLFNKIKGVGQEELSPPTGDSTTL